MGLRGTPERGVVTIHQHLRHDRGDVLVDPALEQPVLEGLLEGIADGALAVRDAHVEGDLVQALHPGGNLGTTEDEAHLGPVAVPDRDLPPGLDHVGNVTGRLLGGLPLVLHAPVRGIPDQGVAADGDDGDLATCLVGHACPPSSRPAGDRPRGLAGFSASAARTTSWV